MNDMKLPHISPQTIAFVVITFILLFLACGCATDPTTKVDLMAYCDEGLDASLLREPCARSSALPASAVFQDSLAANKTANTQIDECRVKVEKLQKALSDCRAAVVNHNQVIQAIAAGTKK